MHGRISRRAFGLAFATCVVGVSGCGSRRFDVTGKVTYNGASLDKPDGHVVFLGPHGEQVTTAIGSDGTYQAIGVASGLNRVAVYYVSPKAKKEKAGKLKPGEQPPPAEALYLTPAKYASPETSELSVTVDKECVYDIPLVGPTIR